MQKLDSEDALKINKPLEQSYTDRKFIVIADNRVVQESRDAELKELRRKNPMMLCIIVFVILALALVSSLVFLRTTVMCIMVFVILALALVNSLVFIGFILGSMLGDERKPEIDPVQISATEAKKLTFTPGHPRQGVLYIGHPVRSDVYYTTAEFHPLTFEHKFAEAIRLLMHLGATEINVEHVRGWSRDFSGNISAPIPSAGTTVQVSAEADALASKKTSLLFQATLDGTNSPKLPNPLSWYPHESSWQAISEARIDFDLRDFVLNVTYNDDYGINAKVKALISKAGLDIGGKFEDHVSTEWKISGKFKSKLDT